MVYALNEEKKLHQGLLINNEPVNPNFHGFSLDNLCSWLHYVWLLHISSSGLSFKWENNILSRWLINVEHVSSNFLCFLYNHCKDCHCLGTRVSIIEKYGLYVGSFYNNKLKRKPHTGISSFTSAANSTFKDKNVVTMEWITNRK